MGTDLQRSVLRSVRFCRCFLSLCCCLPFFSSVFHPSVLLFAILAESSCKRYFAAHKADAAALGRIGGYCAGTTRGDTSATHPQLTELCNAYHGLKSKV